MPLSQGNHYKNIGNIKNGLTNLNNGFNKGKMGSKKLPHGLFYENKTKYKF
ncbi:MAG: hypothetical protein ACD_28C00100G0002 [uncultured bacterium]|nr:MAG: hypothetical protein ACD_28C00100G0002 [uncultured bacterium]